VFDRSNGACPVGDVVQRIGLSSRRFVDLFRAEVGLSPKVYCRIRRFNEALRRVEQLTDVDWVDVALSCGYFDQAHFNHDFRAFSGVSPSTYLRHRTARTHVAITD
jgi:AraC-like DNA-binding protein